MANVRSFVGHETDLKLVMNRGTDFNINQIFLMPNFVLYLRQLQSYSKITDKTISYVKPDFKAD